VYTIARDYRQKTSDQRILMKGLTACRAGIVEIEW